MTRIQKKNIIDERKWAYGRLSKKKASERKWEVWDLSEQSSPESSQTRDWQSVFNEIDEGYMLVFKLSSFKCDHERISWQMWFARILE